MSSDRVGARKLGLTPEGHTTGRSFALEVHVPFQDGSGSGPRQSGRAGMARYTEVAMVYQEG